jgi:sortase A
VFREGDSLLRVGVVMMALALALVIAAVVVSVALRGGDAGWMAAAEVAAKSSDEPTQAVAAPESELAESSSGPQPGKPHPAGQQTPSGAQSEPGPQPEREALLAAEGDSWPEPTQEEIQSANNPRHYGLTPGAIMGLTIEGIGIHDAPVFDSDSHWALANGIGHNPETSLPWSETPQRNVYLAGHRMGFRGTWSRMIFYNLDELALGDRVVLKDRAGRSYGYEVSEVFLADPEDVWVMGQVRGRDMVTLQTCTPIPTFEKRLIVRADRV